MSSWDGIVAVSSLILAPTTRWLTRTPGLFAGSIGVRRLLKMFEKYNIKTTWFIPGHSLETFPEECRMIADAGHEIGLHGYSHENPIEMTLEQQTAIMDKVRNISLVVGRPLSNRTCQQCYKLITEFQHGKPPRGMVAPWYVVSQPRIKKKPSRKPRYKK